MTYNPMNKEIKRVKQDEGDIQKLLSCFSTGLMTDPFSCGITDLMNLASGVVLPADLAEALVRCTSKGREHMNSIGDPVFMFVLRMIIFSSFVTSILVKITR